MNFPGAHRPSEAYPMRPALSLILCSRNDQYMGNSLWRLTTALNYVARHVSALGRASDVEVLVCDWGSEVPLRDVLKLEPVAARIVSFVTVPPGLARELQRDSPFPEVLALNAAARRACGDYIGRIDQDTLVGERFLRLFFGWLSGAWPLDAPLDEALLFANRRNIPYRFAAHCPKLEHVTQFVRRFGRNLDIARHNLFTGDVFWTSYVGLWLAHRTVWHECGGYDERLIYYNWMESDIICRLKQKYAIVDLGELTEYDFYHLEHYNPRASWSARRHLQKNPDIDLRNPPTHLHPNSDTWGLQDHDLPVMSPSGKVAGSGDRVARGRMGLVFPAMMLRLAIETATDNVVIAAKASRALAVRGLRAARRRTAGQRLTKWPAVLWRLWADTKAARLR